ncbi:MAG TPA: M56 family metallopeptidase [Pirellulales bacterium]|jgi:beta-lactamase regulating signal transducer with metallopeptidase domain|nr:M56 family metallopeptidase [Pirellulales bacterium]
MSAIAIVYSVSAAVWFVVAGVLLARLAVAHLLMSLTRRRALPADAATLEACRRLAAALGIKPPQVLFTSALRLGRLSHRENALVSPCLLGWWRPAILLPAVGSNVASAVSDDVLVHELAHLARHDALWNLIGRVAASALWFQPLLALLVRRGEQVADDVCDDYVVAHGADRADYAAELVEVAGRFQVDWPLATAGVGIVTFRSSLGLRVQRILDTSRALSTRTGRATLCGILLCGIACTLLAGWLGAGANRAAAGPQATQDAEQRKSADDGDKKAELDSQAADDKSAVVRGRVHDPEGKPLAGAKLYLSYPNRNNLEPRLLGTSGAEGQFEFRVDKSQLDTSYMPDPWPLAIITATAAGFGLEWVDVAKPDDDGTLTIRLVNDLPIHGRVLTLEGKPVAGARLRLRQFNIPENNLDAFVEGVCTGAVGSGAQFQRGRAKLPDVPDEMTADDEGRFTLNGLGAERVVELAVEAPGIAWASIHIMTRECEPVVRGPGARMTPLPDRAYGATFEYLASPARPIVGTVRDQETGAPVAGAKVRGRNLLLNFTKSDENGRFELPGEPKVERHFIEVVPDGLPYFAASVQLDDTPGFEPLTVDVRLHRGITARGRVSAKPSGAPNQATVDYYPLLPNQHVAKLGPRLVQGNQGRSSAQCGHDGSYALPVLPGPGVLAFRAGPVSPDYYRLYASALITPRDLEEFFHESADKFFPTGVDPPPDGLSLPVASGGPMLMSMTQTNYNRLVLIDPAEDAQELTQDATIEVGRTVPGRVEGPDGEPLVGVHVRGLDNSGYKPERLETAEFTVLALNPRRPRALVFEFRERRLGFHAVIAGDEPGPLVVRLQPCGALVGRLLDAEAEPLAGSAISVGRHRITPPELTVRTDAEGRFRAEGLVPGLKYDLVRQREPGVMGIRFVADGASVEPGETKDLGDVAIKPPAAPASGKPKPGTQPPGQPKPNDESQTKPTERRKENRPDGALSAPPGSEATQKAAPDDNMAIIYGRVLDPEGKPLAGAKLYLWYPSGNLLGPQPLGRCGANGAFEFRIDKSQLDTSRMHDPWSMAKIIAAAEGFGFESVDASQASDDGRYEIALAPELLIHGQILTLEGRPVAGAKAALRGVLIPAGKNLDGYIEAFRKGNRPGPFDGSAPPPPGYSETTDDSGRFTFRGVGGERVASVTVEGPGIASSHLYVMTRESEMVEFAKTPGGRPITDRVYGATFQLVAQPSRTIVGTVRDRATGEPIAGVRMEARGVQPPKTGTDGRFELVGLAKGNQYVIDAVPDGLPYFRAGARLADAPGIDPLRTDFDLVRGVAARGRVTVRPTGAPIQAHVDYYPLLPNTHAKQLGVIASSTQCCSSADCGPDGSYVIAVLPGPGVLAFSAGTHSPDTYNLYAAALITRHDLADYFHKDAAEFFRSEMLASQDDSFLPVATGGRLGTSLSQTSYNKLVLIDLPGDTHELTQDATIEVGRTVVGRVETPDGEPLAGVRAQGLNSVASSKTDLSTSEFTVVALNPRRRRELVFEHRERRLGYHTVIAGDEQGPLVIRLQPCGEVVGRLLDVDGEPLAGSLISISPYIGSAHGPALFSVTTDVEGRFRTGPLVPGAKYELGFKPGSRSVKRDVTLEPGETRDLGDVRTETPSLGKPKPNDGARQKPPPDKADNPAAETRTIVGTVRDQATGKPIAAVKVVFQNRLAGGMPAPLGGSGIASEDQTDDQGRYELVEVAKGKQYSVLVLPEGLPYFGASAQLADAPGVGALTADFELRSGIPAVGHVTVRPTGEPNQARVEYFPLKPNFHVGGLGPFERDQPWASAICRADGSYTVPVLPGPGVLAFRAAPVGQDDQPFYAQAFLTRQDLEEFFHIDADKFFYEWHSSGVNETLPVASGRSGNWAEILQTRAIFERLQGATSCGESAMRADRGFELCNPSGIIAKVGADWFHGRKVVDVHCSDVIRIYVKPNLHPTTDLGKIGWPIED